MCSEILRPLSIMDAHMCAMKLMTRTYTLKRRAEQQAETRQRIVEAAVDLHGSVGPAATTFSMIAERAGVQRHTLYAHFPDERSLYLACSGLYDGSRPASGRRSLGVRSRKGASGCEPASRRSTAGTSAMPRLPPACCATPSITPSPGKSPTCDGGRTWRPIRTCSARS